MHVLITGGLGYVGQALSRRLLADGHRLTLLGRQMRSHRLPAESFQFVRSDVREMERVDCRPDAVIHLACANGSGSDPAEDYEVTVHGTRRLLEWCARRSVGRFLFFSTAQVYGDLHGRRINEQTAATPINDYGLTHAVAEDILAMYVRRGELRGLVVRPTIGYGELDPAQPRWSITPGCFVRDALERRAIVLTSNGRQFRNYVPMGYMADCVARAIARWETFPQLQVLNLSGAETLRVRDVAELVKSVAESHTRQPVALQVDGADTRDYQPFEISRVRQEALAGEPPRRLRPAVEAMLESLLAARA